MKKFYRIADLTVYAEVEAENEDEAWRIGRDLPFSAWDLNDEVGEIWDISEAD